MKPRHRRTYCQRTPCGRLCIVLKTTPEKVLIRDPGFWTGWVSRKTFAAKWRIL